MPLKNEWADKNEIARELHLGPRRVLGLAKEYSWRSKPGEKTPGIKQPLRLFATADVLAWSKRKEPAINQDGSPVPAPVPQALTRRAAEPSGLILTREAMETLIAALLRKPPEALQAPETRIEPHQYVSLRFAAKHIGLSRTVLERACDSGQLSYVEDRGRRVVRLRDVEEIDFGFAGRTRGADA